MLLGSNPLLDAIRLRLVNSQFVRMNDLTALSSSSSALSTIVRDALPSIASRTVPLFKNLNQYCGLNMVHVVLDRHSDSKTWRIPRAVSTDDDLSHLAAVTSLKVSVLNSCHPGLSVIRKASSSPPASSSRWRETNDPLGFLQSCVPGIKSLQDLDVFYYPLQPEKVVSFIQSMSLEHLISLRLGMFHINPSLKMACSLVEKGLLPNLESLQLSCVSDAEMPDLGLAVRLLRIIFTRAEVPKIAR